MKKVIDYGCLVLSCLAGGFFSGLISFSDTLFPKASSFIELPIGYQIGIILSGILILFSFVLTYFFRKQSKNTFLELIIEGLVFFIGFCLCSTSLLREVTSLKSILVSIGAIIIGISFVSSINSIITINRKNER